MTGQHRWRRFGPNKYRIRVSDITAALRDEQSRRPWTLSDIEALRGGSSRKAAA